MSFPRDHRRGGAGPVWLDLLPVLAFAATFGVFFVDKSTSAGSVLRSWRGLLVVGAVMAGYLFVSLVLRRTARRIAPVVMALVVVGLAAWIVRPYYVDSTRNHRLVTDPVPAAGGMPVGARRPAEASTPVAPGPVLVASGPLAGIDHRASGTASLVSDVDGALVVRLSDFDVEGVPDPRVHLVQGEDVERAGGLDLGRLPANKGDVFDIAVPAGSTAGPGWTVLIWCRAFSVPVANATLAAPPR